MHRSYIFPDAFVYIERFIGIPDGEIQSVVACPENQFIIADSV